MINKRIMIKVFIIFFILIICSFNCISLAGSKNINTKILDPNFTNEFDPNGNGGKFETYTEPFTNIIVKVVSRIMTILQVFGGIIFVISLAMAGLNGIFGVGEGLAEDLGLNMGKTRTDAGMEIDAVNKLNKGSISKIIRRSIIGSVILFSSTTIVKITFQIFSGL